MSILLQSLCLAPPEKQSPKLSGLVSLSDEQLPPQSISEQVSKREAILLTGSGETQNIPIDYIFFRRFNDERSSQIAAYIVDNSQECYTQEQIAELHYRVWLSGHTPLLYVEWPTRVDILKCAAGTDFWDSKNEIPAYKPAEVLEIVSNISYALDESQIRRFSAYRLSDGTFWDAPENASWACADKAAHKSLIQAVIDADKDLEGNKKPLMRRFLLLFILTKYLEDRGVFPRNWFNQFYEGADSFLSVLASGDTTAVEQMLENLRIKFNGDIFDVSSKTGIDGTQLTSESLIHFYTLLEAKTLRRQMHLWKLFSFSYIPVQVLSHLYQHFAQKEKGAVFTPPLLVDLMLDYAMPYKSITGKETVFDPTCGSGIFLVGAFRRLVHHWQAHNNWERPGVPLLKKMLKSSIFGVEIDPNAAQVAAFNLALAVCDALQPKIIWDHLQFDKLIGQNILVGDVFENLNAIQNIVKAGFTTILGNPPFISKLTEAALTSRAEHNKNIPIPDKQISYRIAEEAMTLLAPQGHMCLIQPAGFLYNTKAHPFLVNFLTQNTIETVLDFVSIRNLFEGADPKTVAIVASSQKPKKEHKIVHLTFRRTKSIHERIGFELDHYDLHKVPQTIAESFSAVWKTNLVGGGRLVYLAQKISEKRTLKAYCDEMGWTHGEGFIVGNPPQGEDNRKLAEWLTGKPFLPTQALKDNGITNSAIGEVQEKKFKFTATKKRFIAPMFLIRENESLPTAFIPEGYLTFLDKIVSINAPVSDTKKLQLFSEAFEKNKNIMRAFCFLKSSQALVGKSTAILKRDIDELPWPQDNGELELAWWEKLLLDDVLTYTSKLIQIGQNAPVLTDAVDELAFNKYAQLFTRLLGSVYSNLTLGKSDRFGGLAYQAFYFGKQSDLDWPDDWSEKLINIIHKNKSAIHTTRVVRFYETNTLIIVKPDRLRYWIPSTAIWDADETLCDLQHQGF